MDGIKHCEKRHPLKCHSFRKRSNFPRIWFRDLRFGTWGLEINHLTCLKAHTFVWQGRFFLSFISRKFDDRLSSNFHRFVILCICWDTPTMKASLWQLPIVSTAFKKRLLLDEIGHDVCIRLKKKRNRIVTLLTHSSRTNYSNLRVYCMPIIIGICFALLLRVYIKHKKYPINFSLYFLYGWGHYIELPRNSQSSFYSTCIIFHQRSATNVSAPW